MDSMIFAGSPFGDHRGGPSATQKQTYTAWYFCTSPRQRFHATELAHLGNSTLGVLAILTARTAHGAAV